MRDRRQTVIRPDESAMRRALDRDPNDAAALHALGVLRGRGGDAAEAVELLGRAAKLRPDRADVLNDLGVALESAGDAPAATDAYRRALALRPNWNIAWTNLGNALLHSGDAIAAEEACRRSIQLNGNWAPAHNALGCTLLEQASANEAEQCFRAAIRLQPDFAPAHANLGSALLMLGNFEAGWQEREWRRKFEAVHRNRRGKSWQGEDPFGHTILLYGEGGLGNVIQFSRYVPVLARMGARIVLECQKELHPLLANLPGVWKTCEYGQKVDGWEMYCPLASLPAVLGTRIETVPDDVPYLHLGQGGSPATRPHPNPLPEGEGVKGKRRIGVCWCGDQRVPHLRGRSFDPMHLLPLARISGVELVNLQHGVDAPAALPLTTLPGLAPHSMRVENVAASMMDLHLVITCDTSIAHLAGALGVPVWVALKHAACWRWMLAREESPWYPTMRLFRQPRAGEWTPVFERMAEGLAGKGHALPRHCDSSRASSFRPSSHTRDCG